MSGARILDLFGKVGFDAKYDYKRQRRREGRAPIA